MKYSIIALFLLVSLSWASAVEKPDSKREPRNAFSQFLSKLSNERRVGIESAIQEAEAKAKAAKTAKAQSFLSDLGHALLNAAVDTVLNEFVGQGSQARANSKKSLVKIETAKKQDFKELLSGAGGTLLDVARHELCESQATTNSLKGIGATLGSSLLGFAVDTVLDEVLGSDAKANSLKIETAKKQNVKELLSGAGGTLLDVARHELCESQATANSLKGIGATLGNALLGFAVDTVLDEVLGSDAKANSLKIETAKKQNVKELLSGAGGTLLDVARRELCESQATTNSLKGIGATLGSSLLGFAVDTVLDEVLGSDAKAASKNGAMLAPLLGTAIDRAVNHDSATKENKASKESEAKIESEKVLLNELEEALAKLH